jgi:hypothetical protein
VARARAPGVEWQLRARLAARFRPPLGAEDRFVEKMAACIMAFLRKERAILTIASETQTRINGLLGRAPPQRPFTSGAIDVHNLLQGAESRRLPYLIDELADALGIEISIDPSQIAVRRREARAAG